MLLPYHHRGTSLNAMKRFCICSLCFYLNVLTVFPLDSEMLRRSRRVLIFTKYYVIFPLKTALLMPLYAIATMPQRVVGSILLDLVEALSVDVKNPTRLCLYSLPGM